MNIGCSCAPGVSVFVVCPAIFFPLFVMIPNSSESIFSAGNIFHCISESSWVNIENSENIHYRLSMEVS